MVFGAIRLKEVLSVDFTDFSYSAFASHAWSVVEAGVAIIVVCSIHLRPIFDRVFRRLITSLRSTGRAASSAPLSKESNSKGQNSRASRGHPNFEMWPLAMEPQTSVVGSAPHSEGDTDIGEPLEAVDSKNRIWVKTEFTQHG